MEKVKKIDEDKNDFEEKSYTYVQDAVRRLKKNKVAMFGLIIIVLMLLLAVMGPYFSKYGQNDQNLDFSNVGLKLEVYELADGQYISLEKGLRILTVTKKGQLLKAFEPIEMDMMNKRKIYDINGEKMTIDFSKGSIKLFNSKEEPMKVHKKLLNKTFIFGTDKLGRDMLTRLIYGAKISLLIAFVATISNVFIGVLYGGISGYAGGWIDNLMIRIVDVISTVPLMLYIIILMVAIGPGIKTIIIAMVSVGWTGIVRQVRGQMLMLKTMDYALAAKTIGVSDLKIIVRHLLPNAMGTIIVSATFMIPDAIFTEAFLSFIGLGIPAPNASWGTICENGVEGFRVFPYQLILPAAFITVTILAFNLLGDGLRDAFDPRLRQ